jgi:hypothetical protein
MGNRAVITLKPHEGKSYGNQVGIYVHWNGGRDSIEAFLPTVNYRVLDRLLAIAMVLHA